MTCYVIKTSVLKVEERDKVLFAEKTADGSVITERQSSGWWLVLDGLGISIHVGFEKPGLEPGDQVEITIRKRT